MSDVKAARSTPQSPPHSTPVRWRKLERRIDKTSYELDMMRTETRKLQRETDDIQRQVLAMVTSLAALSMRSPSSSSFWTTRRDNGDRSAISIASDSSSLSTLSFELQDPQRLLDSVCVRARDVSMHIEAEGTPVKEKVVKVPSSILKRRRADSDATETMTSTSSCSKKRVHFVKDDRDDVASEIAFFAS